MVFSSTAFLYVFLPAVLLLYYLPVRKNQRQYRNVILMLASLAFYAWGEPTFVFLMVIIIVANWKLCLLMEVAAKAKKKGYLVSMCILDLGCLFVFKYLSFVTKNLGLLLNREDVMISIALPIGISFFIFEMLSYVFDVYYESCKAQKSLLNVALYISMFPQLVAGPIVRYSVVSEDIENRKENWGQFSEGVRRFIYGLGKKVILANHIAIVADYAFAMAKNETLGAGMAYVGVLSYLIQLYFDFSGYSDMAIGLGKMFGFEFEENFDYPYLSKSITEYWRRWHISLGNWFRDYVMYPVMRTKTADRIREAGTKKFSKKTGKLLATVYATAVVWLLTGIWHGANWTFLLFGIYHGFFVILRMVLKEPWKKVEAKYHLEGKKWNTVWCILRTICLAAIGDVMFRADSMTEAFTYYKAMLGMGVAGGGATEALFFLKNFAGLYLLGILGFFPVVKKLKETTKVKEEVKDVMEAIYLILVLVISISYLTRGSYNPFVYFNF